MSKSQIEFVAPFTAEEKRKAVEREISWRQRVYPQRVSSHRMRAEDAAYQIAIMRAILRDYEAQCEKERLL